MDRLAMKVFNLFRKKETRNVKLSGWIPWDKGQVDSLPRQQSGNLSQLKRALALYRDTLLACPLIAKNDKGDEITHPLIDLLNRPAPWLNKTEFFTLLTTNYFLSGNFYCHIVLDNNAQVKALLPYPPGSIFCYAKTGSKSDEVSSDSSDPLLLYKNGYYYQTQFATGQVDENKKPVMRVTKQSSQDIWHLKNLWQTGGDPLNGLSLFQQYPEILSFSQSILNLGDRFAESGGVGPVLISGVASASSKEMKEHKQTIETFFEQKGMFLTLPPDVEISEIGKSATPQLVQALSSISSLHLARIMNCPVQLIEREDALNTSGGGQNLKETYRFFLRSSAKSYIKNVESKLQELNDVPQTKIEFNFRSLMASDLRESAMSLSQLVQNEIVTKEQIQDWLRI